jgi:hypothetical protein
MQPHLGNGHPGNKWSPARANRSETVRSLAAIPRPGAIAVSNTARIVTLRVVDVRASEDPEENAVLINSEQVA